VIRGWAPAVALVLSLLAGAVASARDIDCPARNEPYGSRTVMLDLMLDPAARAVIERLAPSIAKPPFGDKEWMLEPPTFAAILTPASLLRSRTDAAALDAALDAELGRIALTPAVRAARCARYDAAPPALPARVPRPALLVFGKINGFRDVPSVTAANRAVAGIAAARGWTLVATDNGAVFNARNLARFDAVLWNNVSGDVLTLSQRAAFRRWIERGGGYAGMHGSGGDPVTPWAWYAETLIGARFIGHPMTPQFQSARVRVEDPANPITAGLGTEWTMTEEWYSFDRSPRRDGSRVLLTLDESSYAPIGLGKENLAMGDHPIAWTRCVGRGRSFYSAIGHRPENYEEPHSRAVLERGLAWAMDGTQPGGCPR